jgi:hypothetical protein
MKILSTIRHRICCAPAAILGSALFGLVPGTVADAANPEPVTTDMDFLAVITITENASLRFGLLNVNMANNQRVTIDPDGTVTDTQNNILGGTQAPADLTVAATASQSITILADNVSTATGYTFDRMTCIYNSGTSTRCDGTGYTETTVASATLKIGGRLTANGNAVVGTDNSTFDVTVTYQ